MGLSFREAPLTVLPLAECVPGDFLLDRWSLPSTDAMLHVPLEDRILDTNKNSEAQLARDQVRASRLYPSRWQGMILFGLRPRS